MCPKALFQGATVGGQFGVDRDPRTGDYVLISDRSAARPARFYPVKIDVRVTGLGEVKLTDTHLFLRKTAPRIR